MSLIRAVINAIVNLLFIIGKGVKKVVEAIFCSPEAKGRAGERRVSRILHTLPSLEYWVFDDVRLNEAYGKKAQIDHVVVSLYGIFCIETKKYSGTVYGNVADQNWTVDYGYEKVQMYNPIKQNEGHVEAIRSINWSIRESYRKYDLGSIIPITVHVGNNKWKITGDTGGNFIPLKDLKKHILSFKEYRITRTDAERLVACFNARTKHKVRFKYPLQAIK